MKKSTLKILNAYYIFTVLYYCFGRYNWQIPSYIKLLTYVFLCYLALNIGYVCKNSGHGKIRLSIRRNYKSVDIDYTPIRPFFLVSAFSMILFQIIIVIVFFERFSVFNVLSMIGDNYYSRLHTSFDSTIPIMQIRTMLWGLTYFVYPITFLFYKKMGQFDRIVAISTIVVDVLSSLNLGVSKNIGDIVIAVIAMASLKSVVSVNRAGLSLEHKRSVRRVGIALIAFLILFNNIQSARYAVRTVISNPFYNFASIRENTIYTYIFGANSSIVGLIDRIGGYFSNWYTGLAYALEIPFQNTYGIGFSRALMEYASQYLHISVSEFTYNARIEALFGWKNGQWWPTAFVWIANSVSFIFVPLVLFFLGKLLRKLEDEFAENRNFIVATLYCQLFVLLFYLPCNMQIFQSRQSLFGMIFVIFMYKIRKKVIKRFRLYTYDK